MQIQFVHMMAADSGKEVVREPGQNTTVQLGPNKITFLLSGEETGGEYSVTEFQAAPPPAPSALPHIHKDADEAMYVLEGDFTVHIRDQLQHLPKGGFVLVRKGTLHTIANTGTTEGKLLIVLTPSGFEKYWEEMSKLLIATNGKPDPSAVLVLQEKYHMDMGGKARQFT